MTGGWIQNIVSVKQLTACWKKAEYDVGITNKGKRYAMFDRQRQKAKAKGKGKRYAMFDMCILTCMVVATRRTRILPNLLPHPHPILNLQSTESEKVGQQN